MTKNTSRKKGKSTAADSLAAGAAAAERARLLDLQLSNEEGEEVVGGADRTDQNPVAEVTPALPAAEVP